MSFQGHIENGVVVFDEPVSIPEGTTVRVEPLESPWTGQADGSNNVIGTDPESAINHVHGQQVDTDCFRNMALARRLDASTKKALQTLLTQVQYEALVEVVDQGGPDVEAIRKIRSASM